MPNGGSDCCGTCPFNRKNRGEAGYTHASDPGPDRCELRDLAIEHSFYTYCANHPNHNRDLVRVPIGPVYRHGEDEGRYVWRPGPDTPEVRAEVSRLLAAATPEPVTDYPAGVAFVEAAILQAGELGDVRFVSELERIRRFQALAPLAEGEHRLFVRDPARSAAFAARSLARILPPAEILPFVSDTVRQVAATVDQSGDAAGLAILADALQEAGCAHAATLNFLRDPQTRAVGGPWWVVDVILGQVAELPP